MGIIAEYTQSYSNQRTRELGHVCSGSLESLEEGSS